MQWSHLILGGLIGLVVLFLFVLFLNWIARRRLNKRNKKQADQLKRHLGFLTPNEERAKKGFAKLYPNLHDAGEDDLVREIDGRITGSLQKWPPEDVPDDYVEYWVCDLCGTRKSFTTPQVRVEHDCIGRNQSLPLRKVGNG